MNAAGFDFEETVARTLEEIFRESTPMRLHRCSSEVRSGMDALCFELRGEGISRLVFAQVKRHPQLKDIEELRGAAARARVAGATLLVAAPVLDAGLRRALREDGISHADLGGTLFLQAPGVAVLVEGKRRHAPIRAGGSEPNPFADRASLVLRALMREPERAWGVRELASSVGISAGLASQTVAELTRRGYAAEQGGRLVLADAVSALADWAEQTPWPKSRMRSFVAPFDEPDELSLEAWRVVERVSPGRTALTQLAALDVYAPHVVGHGQVHLYCAHEDFEAAAAGLAASLYAAPVRQGGNLHLVRPSARRATGFDARVRDGVRVVSPVQLFLDLLAYPVRGSEGAGMLARTVLAGELGLAPAAVARLLRRVEAR